MSGGGSDRFGDLMASIHDDLRASVHGGLGDDIGALMLDKILRGELDGQTNVIEQIASGVLGHTLCHSCGKKDPPLRCSQCLRSSYCDRACQTAHWCSHKEGCKHLAIEGGEDGKIGRMVDRARKLAIKETEERLKGKVRRVKAVFDAHGKDAAVAEIKRQHEEEQLPAERACVLRGHSQFPPCFIFSASCHSRTPLPPPASLFSFPAATAPLPNPPTPLPPLCAARLQRCAFAPAPWAAFSRPLLRRGTLTPP